MSEEQKPKFPWTLIIILMIIVIIAVGIYYGPKSTFVKEQYQKISVQLKGVFKFVSSPEKEFQKEFGWKTDTQAVEKEEPKGVEITEFGGKDKLYYTGEPVETTSNVKIYGLKENIKTYVNLKCECSDGIEGAIFISDEESSRIEIKPYETKSLSVDCKFDELNEGTNKIKLSANYENFKSRAELKVYTLKKETLDSLGTTDAFSYYKIKEPLRKSDKTIKSTYSYGPLILTLNLNNAQPIDEVGSYRLYVNLREDTGWKGKFEKLKSVQLILPDKFTASENCDFGSNLILNENELEGVELKEKGKDYWCIFKVNEADEKLTYSTIELQVSYDYTFEKETTVKVEPEESSVTA